jgi:hypothetical protein
VNCTRSCSSTGSLKTSRYFHPQSCTTPNSPSIPIRLLPAVSIHKGDLSPKFRHYLFQRQRPHKGGGTGLPKWPLFVPEWPLWLRLPCMRGQQCRLGGSPAIDRSRKGDPSTAPFLQPQKTAWHYRSAPFLHLSGIAARHDLSAYAMHSNGLEYIGMVLDPLGLSPSLLLHLAP